MAYVMRMSKAEPSCAEDRGSEGTERVDHFGCESLQCHLRGLESTIGSVAVARKRIFQQRSSNSQALCAAISSLMNSKPIDVCGPPKGPAPTVFRGTWRRVRDRILGGLMLVLPILITLWLIH